MTSVSLIRETLEITVVDGEAPNPVLKFDEACLPRYLLDHLKCFDKPTPIQS